MGILISNPEHVGIRSVISNLQNRFNEAAKDAVQNDAANGNIIPVTMKFVELTREAGTFADKRLAENGMQHDSSKLNDAKKKFDLEIRRGNLNATLETELSAIAIIINNTARAGIAPKIEDGQLHKLAEIGNAQGQAQLQKAAAFADEQYAAQTRNSILAR